MPADQPIQLEVVREGEVRKLLVKAGVKEPLEVPPPPPPGLPPGQSLLEAVEVGPGPQGQPVVTAFHPYMVVATRPLAVGDRILEVDRNPVESVEDFRALRERTRNADRLLLRIEDGGMRRYLVLKRP
jgi:membrane-associated protease RseP (regulator of RpoE activity)